MSKVQIETAQAIYGILHKGSGKFVKLGPKVSWHNVSGAKRAMQVHIPGFKFNEQEEFIVVCLSEAFYRLEGLMK